MTDGPVTLESEPGSRDPEASRRLGWVLIAAVPLLIAYYTVQLRALAPAALRGDLDIQFTLAERTARGAIPLIDFEHGWNTASWYFSALLYRLADGNPTLWTFLWGRVTGFMLAGFALLAIAWRLRLPPMWAAILVPTWMLVTHVPNSKYALPLLWCLVLLPVGALRRPVMAQVVRVGLVATVFWFHIELAVLLGAGTAMYDLFGARALPVSERLRRVVAVGAGLVLALGLQVLLYRALGLAPADLLRQLLFAQPETAEANFGYPLLAPGSFRTLIWPATLLAPFVPLLWRRLSEPTRFVAFLHLSQALIGIRRTDDNHIAAAATLLGLLVVLVALDLVRTRLPRPVWMGAVSAAAGLAGVVWVAAALIGGLRVESRAAIVLLCIACLVAVAVAARIGDVDWASIGALTTLGAVLVAGLVGWTVSQVRADEAGQEAVAIAEAVADDVDRCLRRDRLAWIVPGPLGLYDALDIENPTPFYLFWYTLEAETDRVIAMIEAGEIPAVVQVGGWPEAMRDMAPTIERDFSECAVHDGPPGRVVIWVRR